MAIKYHKILRELDDKLINHEMLGLPLICAGQSWDPGGHGNHASHVTMFVAFLSTLNKPILGVRAILNICKPCGMNYVLVQCSSAALNKDFAHVRSKCFSHVVPSGNLYKRLWKITIFNGKTHYFNGHFQ